MLAQHNNVMQKLQLGSSSALQQDAAQMFSAKSQGVGSKLTPLMQMQKMMGQLEKDRPQVCHGLLYKDMTDSRCNE